MKPQGGHRGQAQESQKVPVTSTILPGGRPGGDPPHGPQHLGTASGFGRAPQRLPCFKLLVCGALLCELEKEPHAEGGQCSGDAGRGARGPWGHRLLGGPGTEQGHGGLREQAVGGHSPFCVYLPAFQDAAFPTI